jgi:Protein of unknown function (DUF1097)
MKIELEAKFVETETKERIPLWLAVAITVVVSLPFGLYLDKYNLPLWVAFVVWAEYFALGAKPQALRIIVPAFALGVALTGVIMVAVAVLAPSLPTNGALAVCLFVGVGAMVFGMRYSKTLQAGSLPYFNGISMLLGVYFTGAFPSTFTGDANLLPLVAAVWAILGGLLGAALGWFNVTITFPHLVASSKTATGAVAPTH